MAILKVTKSGSSSAISLPDPSEMSISLMDIDAGSTQRSAAGTIIRNRVCGGANAKRKLECKWSGLTMAQASSLMRTIGDVFFKITYHDTYTGAERTSTFYVGDRTCQIYRCKTDGSGAVMESVTANFIER